MGLNESLPSFRDPLVVGPSALDTMQYLFHIRACHVWQIPAHRIVVAVLGSWLTVSGGTLLA